MGISTADYLRMQARLEGRRPDAASFSETKRESDLHDAIIEYCRNNILPYIHSRMDQAATIGVGVCDFTIFGPHGKTIHIEVKTKTGKLSTPQLAWKMMLERVGHEWHLVRSYEEFLKAIGI